MHPAAARHSSILLFKEEPFWWEYVLTDRRFWIIGRVALGSFGRWTNTGHIGLDCIWIIACRALRMSAYFGGVTVSGFNSSSSEPISSPWGPLLLEESEGSSTCARRFPIPPDRDNRKKRAAMDDLGRRRRRTRKIIEGWPSDSGIGVSFAHPKSEGDKFYSTHSYLWFYLEI